MAAPTNAAKREKSSCQLGAVHTWHIASVSAMQRYVRSWEQAGLLNNGIIVAAWESRCDSARPKRLRSEPSTHGTSRQLVRCSDMSAVGSKPDSSTTGSLSLRGNLAAIRRAQRDSDLSRPHMAHRVS